MKSTLSILGAILAAGHGRRGPGPTLNALPNTVYVGADGKFETAPTPR